MMISCKLIATVTITSYFNQFYLVISKAQPKCMSKAEMKGLIGLNSDRDNEYSFCF